VLEDTYNIHTVLYSYTHCWCAMYEKVAEVLSAIDRRWHRQGFSQMQHGHYRSEHNKVPSGDWPPYIFDTRTFVDLGNGPERKSST